MYDPDDFIDPVKKSEVADLDDLLTKLQDCDLTDWDYSFVESLLKRLDGRKNDMFITPRQWEQLERMRSKYNV